MEAERIVLYVAPTGDDANCGTKDAPLRTLAGARDAVRRCCPTTAGDILVYFRGGLYEQRETVVFDDRDSGPNQHKVIYRAYPGEQPLFHGGFQVRDWTLHDCQKNIYKASVGQVKTRQLYINGRRGVRARADGDLLQEVTLVEDGFTSSFEEIATWKNPREIEFVWKKAWTQPRCLVGSITPADGHVHIRMRPQVWHELRTRYPDIRIEERPLWVENALELLDEENEWYLDTDAGLLYYKPAEDVDIDQAEIILPVLQSSIIIAGRGDNAPAHNIEFDGFSFAYGTWLGPMEQGGHPDAQANIAGGVTAGHFRIVRAHNISVVNNHFSYLGNAALDILPGSRDVHVEGNVVHHVSGNGIQIGSVDPKLAKSKQPEHLVARVTLANNYIHHVGVEFPSAVGVFASWVQQLSIVNNTLHDMPYGAINVGWGWGHMEPNVAEDIVIKNNRIHRVTKVLPDNGGIYTLGGLRCSIIEGNYISGVLQYHAGVYLDNGSAYLTVRNNFIANSSAMPYYVQFFNPTEKHRPHDNLIHDNYYCRCQEPQVTHGIFLHENLVNETNIAQNNLDVGCDSSAWPATVQKIIAGAGLQAKYRHLGAESLGGAEV